MDDQIISGIVGQYDIGKLRTFKPAATKHAAGQKSYMIETSSGKYFLKQFDSLDSAEDKNLPLIRSLNSQGFPAVKLYATPDGSQFIRAEGSAFSLFEFIDMAENTGMSAEEAYDVGAKLGQLHVLGRDFQMPKKYYDTYDYTLGMLEKTKGDRSLYVQHKEEISYIESNLKGIDFPKGTPRSLCHTEFTKEHLRFRGGKVVGVIDWDDACEDYMLYDLGTAMSEGFNSTGIDFRLLSSMVAGYNSERELNYWELAHLFEALQFGVIRMALWGIFIKKWVRDEAQRKMHIFAKYNKERFNAEMEKVLKP